MIKLHKILLLVFIPIFIFAAWHWYNQKQAVAIKFPPNGALAARIPAWTLYENKDYGFEFKYPRDFQLSESTKAGDAKLELLVQGPGVGDHKFSAKLRVLEGESKDADPNPPLTSLRRILTKDGLTYDFKATPDSEPVSPSTQNEIAKTLRSLILTNN